MSLAVATALTLLVIVLTRLVPGMVWRWPARDSAYHMLLRRELRRNRLRMPPRISPMLLEDRQTYPWFYHQLLALLPESWLTRMPSLPSTIVDGALAMLVMLVAARLAPLAAPAVDPIWCATAAGLLFATAPALLLPGIGPRAHDVTPRPLGELLVAVALFGTGFWLDGGGWLALVVATLGASLALLTSKFAAQVQLFFVPVMAIAMADAAPLLLLPLALLGAIALSGGRYLHVLVAQWRHLGLFRRRLQHDHVLLRDRNDWRALLGAGAAALRGGGRAACRETARLAEHNTWLQLLLRNVLLLGATGAVIFAGLPTWSGGGAGAGRWLLAWLLAPLAPFVLTSLRAWRFLGEAERYPEYAVPAAAVVAALVLAQVPGDTRLLLSGLYLASLALSLGYGVARRRFNSLRTPVGVHDGLVRFLRTRPRGEVTLAIPWHTAFAVAPVTEQRYLVGNDGGYWAREYDRMFVRYPWPVPDLDYWRERFGASLVVVEPGLIEAEQDPALLYDMTCRRPVWRDGRFEVYEL
jgi:hypothetical protein